jgi:hypothetical protein
MPVALVALAVFGILPGACLLGYWIGRRSRDDELERARSATWQNTLLALSGLLIGFTFSMAEGRYAARKELLIAEANAIGTTYLRTRLIDGAPGEELRAILRRYVDVRLAFVDAGADRERSEGLLRQSGELEAQMWSRIAAVGRADSHSLMNGLLVQAANDMIDKAAAHVAAFDTPLPASVFVVLILATAVAVAAVGHGCGLEKRISVHGMLVMPVLLATVILLVFDLAHPRLGMTRVKDPTLVRLKQSL